MTKTNDGNQQASRQWTLPVVGGVVVAVLLMVLTGASLGSAVITGAVVAIVARMLLGRMVGVEDAAAALQSAPEPAPAPQAKPAPQVETAPPAAPEPAASAEAPAAPAPAAGGPLIKPSTPLPGQQDLAARKGTWRYQGADG